ncbi:rod shape-determining protein [Coprothermobacteraceae bacterium]|nr:rod shape-determining protein [Coprothermobacteraceae bacterium]
MAIDLGIDLGTANSLVVLRGKGIVVSEPSVVGLDRRSQKVLKVGNEAFEMAGKTPENIVVIRPLKSGVIADDYTTEIMLKYLITKAKAHAGFSLFPQRLRVVVGVPTGATPVERRAVEEACRNAGARDVWLVQEPLAAAIGAGLPVTEARGNMIVDIGGGTTEAAVFSLGGLVSWKSVPVAGDAFTERIIEFVKGEFNLFIGERTAETIKVNIGSAYPLDKAQMEVTGRDLLTGLPKRITISSDAVREAFRELLNTVVDTVKETLENTPPELIADVMETGFYISGGGSLLKGLDRLLSERTGVPVHMVEDPLTAVARGAGILAGNARLLKEISST